MNVIEFPLSETSRMASIHNDIDEFTLNDVEYHCPYRTHDKLPKWESNDNKFCTRAHSANETALSSISAPKYIHNNSYSLWNSVYVWTCTSEGLHMSN
ncbi:hypothetical protein HW555_012808 [Spodoptera exigua]|uniref:Uncharacterized protein n=1 Tax=Spodoptera exigua TaxID=7107 RepID=A0A835L368_SPOEX|nr:hypothetical protein HW555_012808 [Spodoptera exigua]